MAIDYSFKPTGIAESIASLYQKKATDEQMMKLQESERETQQQNRVLNVIKMATDLTNSMVQYHTNQQQQSAQNALTSLIGQVNTPIVNKPAISPEAETIPSPIFGTTPEYKTQIEQAVAKAYPEEYGKAKVKELLTPAKVSPAIQPKPFVNLEGKTVMAAPDEKGNFNVPEGYIDPTIARAKVFAQPREEGNIIRKEQFNESQWNKLEKSVNALDKGARSSVGMAAVGNQRAARALAVLNDPSMDPIRLKFVMADLAGIMQGGAPHEIMIRQAGYDNVITKFANLKQQITANPQAIAIPEIREQLKNTIQEIMAVDNTILDTNVGIAKEGFLKAIESDPKRFARMTKALDVVKTVGAKPKANLSLEDKKKELRRKLGL